MLAKARTINPQYPGAAARMADGRLFTDYRANCSLLMPHKAGSAAFGASFEDKQHMQQTGSQQMSTDRSLTVMKAATMSGSVDTMVPELTKRVCAWDGCTTLPSHAVGIGQGRLYLPGRMDLVAGDPDVLAAKTAFEYGTFPTNVGLYVQGGYPTAMPTAGIVPARPNRYSAPYGN